MSISDISGVRREGYFRRWSTTASLSRRVLLAALVAIVAASASPPRPTASDRTLAQFVHKGWTAKDGATGAVCALAQTTDGYLWLGSARGLYRFDGVTFEPYQPQSGPPFPGLYVSALLALPNGDLWIGYAKGGASLLRRGRNINFGDAEGFPQDKVEGMVQDRDGTLWAATRAGLARFEKGRWQHVGADWNSPYDATTAVYVDRRGTLWVSTLRAMLFLPRGARSFQTAGGPVSGIAQFAESRDGTVWVAEPGRSARPLLSSGAGQFSKQSEVQAGSAGILFDDDGSLWITSVGDGLRRVSSPDSLHGETVSEFSKSAESFTVKDGLTSDSASVILKDREGSIWVGTASGVDRFRKGALAPVFLPGKFSSKAMIPGKEGEVWVGTESGGVGRIRGNGFEMERQYAVIGGFRDPAGIVWFLQTTGQGFSLLRVEDGHFGTTSGTLPRSDTSYLGLFAEDGSGALWFTTEPDNVVHQKRGQWVRSELTAEPPGRIPLVGYTDPGGRVWFGFSNNTILTPDAGNNVHSYTSRDGVQVGSVRAIQQQNGHLWIGGEQGLEFLDGNRFRSVIPTGVDTFKGVSGVVGASDGSLWLSEYRGVIRIAAPEVSKALKEPSYRVRYDLFDLRDGLPGEIQENTPYPTTIPGTDGRLWFSTSGGVAWIDPTRVLRNAIPPPVSIRSAVTNGRRYSPNDGQQLPALTRNLQIDYTALSLAIPERVRFRYLLEGSDKDWQDAGSRRQAFYTNLGPGTYRFRVIACNNDGLWNETGAVWSFSITPAFYQTIWFELLCALAVSVLFAVACRLRMRQVASVMKARWDDRLAERTRIARDFHDTLLQTLQGSKIVADDALKHRSDPVRMERALERVSLWLSQAIAEGRSALSSLRSSTEDSNELGEAFERACQEYVPESPLEFRVSVDGDSRDMHPIVRDEVYRIGSEAIRNAFLHSCASELAVFLDYRNDLIVRVRDNGKGMDPDSASSDKAGHFGVLGMYERAARIKGKLTISSSPGSGTQVELIVPDDIVFPQSRVAARRRFGIRWRFFGK